mgnify:CR=1 FL=1
MSVIDIKSSRASDLIDGMRLIEDITFGDSYAHTFYAITNGSYILQTEEWAQLRGEAYRIQNGEIIQISKTGEIYQLSLQ